eukprot:4465723-Amphidinium_carterae.1
MSKVVVDGHVVGETAMELAGTITSQVRNETVRLHGYSPAQWVLGHRGIRIPGSLLSDEEASRLEVLQAADEPHSAVAQQMAARSAAREAFIKLDADSRIRRAVLRLARATPGP